MKLRSIPNGDAYGIAYQCVFGGLDGRFSAADGAIAAMENMSADCYPLLAPRDSRYKLRTLTKPNGMGAGDALFWADGTAFYYDGEVKGAVSDSPKRFYTINRWVTIWPDKLFYNAATDEFGSLEAEVTAAGQFCSREAPGGISSEANCLVLEGTALSALFRPGDGVTISGCTECPENDLTLVVRQVEEDALYFYDNSFTLCESGSVTVRREVPDLDHLCQSGNRLWGVKDSAVYCSALGDPRVWHNYDGTATGCWSVEAGSAGAFTGAVAYGGYPLLFKEDRIYRVYGTKPANFQLMDTQTLGCEAGSEKSFAVVGQTLYYKSPAGFAAYAGGVPVLMDDVLGLLRRQNAVAGTDGRKYYVSVTEPEGQSFYVYDAVLGLWHREDDARVTDFAWCDGALYMLCADGAIWQCGRVRTAAGEPEGLVKSSVEFADFYGNTFSRKAIRRLYFRAETDESLTLSVSYDGRPWETVAAVTHGKKGNIQTLQLVPRRCDSLRVKLEGVGPWKIWAMGREYYAGSTRA